MVQHNLLHPDDLMRARHDVVPSAVFTHPQVASVGLTERQAVERGVRHVVGPQTYGDTAYGWAMEDTTGFAKVLADPDTGLHPRRALPRPAGLEPDPADRAGDVASGRPRTTSRADQYWIHPALMEVIENLLLALPDPRW